MKRPGKTYILQEDQHLENLRKIIKRDFFSSQANEKSDTIQLSLNEYIHNFKSNENHIFSELVESDKDKWKHQHWWFDKQDKLLMVEQQKLKSIQAQSREYQNMIQSQNTTLNFNNKDNQIAIIGQQAKNSIFFNTDKNFGSYLTQESQKSKKINYQNCSLNNSKFQQTKAQEKGQNHDSDSAEQQQEGKLITWGQVDATPLRIAGGQSEYRIPQRPDKDAVLDQLNKKIKNSKIQAQKSSKKSQLMMKIIGSSTPAYKNSSYIKSSSIKRVNAPSTPKNQQKLQKNLNSELKGLLNFQK